MSTNILFASFSRSAALRFLQAHDLVTQYVTEMAKLKPTSSMLPAPTCTTHSTASLNSDKTVTKPDDDLSDDCICEVEYRTCAQCVGLLLRASTKETVLWRRLSTNVLLVQALELCVACSAEEVLRMHLLSSGPLSFWRKSSLQMKAKLQETLSSSFNLCFVPFVISRRPLIRTSTRKFLTSSQGYLPFSQNPRLCHYVSLP